MNQNIYPRGSAARKTYEEHAWVALKIKTEALRARGYRYSPPVQTNRNFMDMYLLTAQNKKSTRLSYPTTKSRNSYIRRMQGFPHRTTGCVFNASISIPSNTIGVVCIACSRVLKHLTHDRKTHAVNMKACIFRRFPCLIPTPPTNSPQYSTFLLRRW